MIYKIIIWSNLSLFLLHEMDAVRAMEWKMMIFFNRLSDNLAYNIFISAHFVMFFIILYMLEFHFMILYWFICLFLIFHQILHLFFIKHPMNRMNSSFSKSIIMLMFLISILGLCYAL